MIFVPMIAASLMSGVPAPSYQPDSYLVSTAPGSALAELQAGDGHASRSNGLYLRLTGGFVTTADSDGPALNNDVKFDKGYLLSVGVGERIGALQNGLGFSAEVEGVYTDQNAHANGTTKALRDVAVLGALVDGIVDLRVGDRLSFYGGAGIGVAWVNVGVDNNDPAHDFSSKDGPYLAWQLRTGVAWRFAPSTSLHVGYRFLNVDDAKIKDGIGSSSFDLQTQENVWEAGLIFGI